MSNNKESGVELLRVISIFLILVVHVVQLIIGVPVFEDLHDYPLSSITKIFFESLSIICVDVFVIISGWYGIRATTKGLAKLLFQCVFFGLIGYVVGCCVGYNVGSVTEVIKSLLEMFFPAWFIGAYIVLYIFSPIINAFVDSVSKLQLQKILGVLLLFVFVYGWIITEDTANSNTFQSGYSSTFLMVLYLMTRYVKVYYFSDSSGCQKWQLKPQMFWFLTWWGLLLGNILLWFLTTWCNIGQISSRIFMYTSPIVIAQSFCMFRYFQMMKFHNSFVLWLGASSMSIMLIHDWCDLELMRHWVMELYRGNKGIVCICMIGLLLIAISIIGVLIDQIRLFLWKPIERNVKWKKLYD